jgi:hypothetical protein
MQSSDWKMKKEKTHKLMHRPIFFTRWKQTKGIENFWRFLCDAFSSYVLLFNAALPVIRHSPEPVFTVIFHLAPYAAANYLYGGNEREGR